ncbi:alternative ribosome rescue aminoacyl-tRNA hydrolase ArfB [Dactylosporangium siamense]|uniref:alternative ribosome rescue aminoacyl-tRNA hydrolase ArfB n=1 Tax=Dactylosporangium siamense TaxID=685454 RepID=UPI0019454765|nr:alternative ribosome rescue aminoacyl-tRNA hydrolase ArfB [Dactylosporangium siamense]
MDDDLRVTDDIALPRTELGWRFSRSGGPGGQSVNTTDSRVELRFDLGATQALPSELKERALLRLGNRLVDGVLSIVASEHRSQLQNRRAAELRLVTVIAQAIAPPPRPRKRTKPSKGAIERRLTDKRRTGLRKQERRRPED